MQLGGVQGRNGEADQNSLHEISKELIKWSWFFFKEGNHTKLRRCAESTTEIR